LDELVEVLPSTRALAQILKPPFLSRRHHPIP
jgi:hypothetical protein